MEERKGNISLRTCTVVQQLAYFPYPFEEFETRIKSLTGLKSYAFIVHDKDVDEEGNLKAPHEHCVLTFSQPTKVSVIGKALGVDKERVNKIITTTTKAMLYLCHLEDASKYTYPVEDVKSSFDYPSFVNEHLNSKSLKEYIEAISRGEILEYELTDKIPPFVYAKHKKEIMNAVEYANRNSVEINRKMKVVFVSGVSGAGKTSFAKDYPRIMGLKSVYCSSGGKNPLDDYKGQECIILDDIRDSTYSLTDLLKLLDNNTASMVGCRYYNKSINRCKVIILTTVMNLTDFYSHVQKEQNESEPIEQLKRRVSLYVFMDEEQIVFSLYDKTRKDFVVTRRSENPYSTYTVFADDVENDDVDRLIDGLDALYSIELVSKRLVEDVLDESSTPTQKRLRTKILNSKKEISCDD